MQRAPNVNELCRADLSAISGGYVVKELLLVLFVLKNVRIEKFRVLLVFIMIVYLFFFF